MSRCLGRADSSCDASLSHWQIRAKGKVQDMYNEAHLNRIPMWKLVDNLVGNPAEEQALKDVTFRHLHKRGYP